MMPVQTQATTTPTEAYSLLARESLNRLSHCLGTGKSDLRISIQVDELQGVDITLPSSAVRLLKDILVEMAEGHAAAPLPVRAELTTQQAAELLNVSRPYLIDLLEHRKIPFRFVGRHRRVRLEDLMAYNREDDKARNRLADELTADAQELSMGY